MRVITYNLARLTGEAPAVAEVLRAAAPDVVGVQEPPRGPWGRARLRRTARAAGLAVVLAGRGARTTALLASPRLLPAAHVEVLRLPWWGSRFVRRWWARRGVVLARLGGVDLAVVHLARDRSTASTSCSTTPPCGSAAPRCSTVRSCAGRATTSRSSSSSMSTKRDGEPDAETA